MANALSLPPPPNIPVQQPQNDAAAGNAAPRQPPAPTHAETVAGLRHLHAIAGELRTLLKDENLGKADVKSTLIDAATKLVGSRIIAPAEAVQQLASFPERPFDQKQWVEQHYAQTVQAQAAILDHHRAQAVGTGNFALETSLHRADPDKHQETMRGMMQAHYA